MKRNIILPEQFVFRYLFDHYQRLYLDCEAASTYLDVSKAFDRVWLEDKMCQIVLSRGASS